MPPPLLCSGVWLVSARLSFSLLGCPFAKGCWLESVSWLCQQVHLVLLLMLMMLQSVCCRWRPAGAVCVGDPLSGAKTTTVILFCVSLPLCSRDHTCGTDIWLSHSTAQLHTLSTLCGVCLPSPSLCLGWGARAPCVLCAGHRRPHLA